MMIKIL